MSFLNIDFLKLLDSMPSKSLRYRLLDRALELKIPFNRGLGLKILSLDEDICKIESRPRRRRTNHVAAAHACFLALMAEYPAGLVLARRFSITRYRLIISELKMSYQKQGRGRLTAVAALQGTDLLPLETTDEFFVPMITTIFDQDTNPIARGETLWQIKPWSKVRQKS